MPAMRSLPNYVAYLRCGVSDGCLSYLNDIVDYHESWYKELTTCLGDYREEGCIPTPYVAQKVGRQTHHGLAREIPKSEDFF